MFTNAGPFSQRFGTFRHAEARSHRTILDENAEGFTMIGRIQRPNAGSIDDPGRPDTSVRGVFGWTDSEQRIGLSEGRVITRKPSIELSRNELPWVPRRGDWFIRRATQDLFEVRGVHMDGFSSILCDLNQIGLPHAEDGPCP